MKQGSTGLTLREFHASRQTSVELTPKHIKHWVEQLPITNLGESSQQVYRLLVDVNKTLLDADLRLSLLNILQPIVQRLIESLEKRFINNHISLSEKQRKIAALVQAIQTELSIGYHTVVESLATNDISRNSKKLLTQSIGLAITHHSLVILRCYQLYATVPSRIWRELYSLYQLSLAHKLENNTFIVPDSNKSYTPKNCFIQIILLSISNPYQLRQNEIELLWTLLPDYVEKCALEAHAFNKKPYVINLKSNKPAVQKSLYKNIVGEVCLKLSVSNVIEQIKTDLSQVQEKARYSARRTMIFKHLIHLWSENTQRSFARTRCEDNIQVSIGLGSTHYLLMENRMQVIAEQQVGEEDTQQTINSQSLDAMEGSLKGVTLSVVASDRNAVIAKSDRNYLSTSAITKKDVWAKLYGQGITLNPPTEEVMLEQRSNESIARDSYKIQECDLINMSPGGYCLQIPSTALPKHAQTGEIIGIIDDDSINNQWSIGVVRWVRRQIKNNNVQMGVQLLAPDATPINIQLRSSKNENHQFQRALLLPSLTGVGQSASIITNPLAFNVNNKVRISEISKDYDVRLTKEINSSGSSKQFYFDILNQNKNKESVEQSDHPKDIDGVWDLI